MHHYTLTSATNQSTLYEGRFHSFTACLEQAVRDNTPLHGINLKNLNLANASLDNARMTGADFTGTNLTGANLSECDLRGANFSGAALYNTCLCDSDLNACDFTSASFGGTDITGASLSHAVFSTLSAFTLEFTAARSMDGCRFTSPDGTSSGMNRPPVVIRGLSARPLVILDDTLKIGHNTIDPARLRRIALRLSQRLLTRRLGILPGPA